MIQSSLQTEALEAFTQTVEREIEHETGVILAGSVSPLAVTNREIQRLRRPSAATAVPLEYAFYLLGDVRGKLVVDMGCGDGVHAVVLASAGARVIAVDASPSNLMLTAERAEANRVGGSIAPVHADATRIPVSDGSVDRVLCASSYGCRDWIGAARQIRRILKPGGAAVFLQPVAGANWIRAVRTFAADRERAPSQQVLTTEEACAISRAVGRIGRKREFLLISRLLQRIGVQSLAAFEKSEQLDAWLMQRVELARAFASRLVWEAQKES